MLKTVISFDEAYLKRHGIVDQAFHCRDRGDYRGHIDQMKLRMAIMHGLDRMSAGSSGFDDLRYVGVLQVDTEHVHCHLAMIDAGTGTLTKNGTQRGKLLDRHKTRLRRGIDTWLDQKQAVAHLSSAVGYERRNVTTFMKRWGHERIRAEALPQFLLACLPDDRTLWRAGSRDARMRKANQLVTDLVVEQLERPGSPMPAAMATIVGYADQRRDSEDLSTEDWQRLIDRGRDQIIERAVNGVYQALRALPEAELRVRTPMLEIMSMDYARMAALASERQTQPRDERGAETDLVSFGFRLRGYASRLRHHTDRAAAYRDLAHQWERAEKASVATEDSRPLYDFYRFEADFHRRLTSKYQQLLPFLTDVGQWYDQQRDVADYGQRLLSLIALRHDTALQRMTLAERAEQVGREIYDQPGGRYLTTGQAGRAVLDSRIATMKRIYRERLDTLRADLSSSGLTLRIGPAGASAAEHDEPSSELTVVPLPQYGFDEVKGLDLHHLGYDFPHDVEIGPTAHRSFVTAATERRRLLLAAMTYLDESGQPEAIPDLPVDDVAAMTRVSRELSSSVGHSAPGSLVLRSKIARTHAGPDPVARPRRSTTSSLDAGLAVRVQTRIDAAVTSGDAIHHQRTDAPDLSTGMHNES